MTNFNYCCTDLRMVWIYRKTDCIHIISYNYKHNIYINIDIICIIYIYNIIHIISPHMIYYTHTHYSWLGAVFAWAQATLQTFVVVTFNINVRSSRAGPGVIVGSTLWHDYGNIMIYHWIDTRFFEIPIIILGVWINPFPLYITKRPPNTKN